MIISIWGELGLETARELVRNNERQIRERFANFFIEQLEGIDVKLAPKGGHMYEINEGGIYGTLWAIGNDLDCGLEINEAAIPIRQEVIEILECFDESPYEVSSAGCYVFVSDEPISGATIIGHTVKNKARLVLEKDFERYLTPPERQKKDIMDRKGYC